MDRKIVELLIQGTGINEISRSPTVGMFGKDQLSGIEFFGSSFSFEQVTIL